MEAVIRIILTTVLTRFIKPHKSKMEIYQVFLKIHIDKILTVVMGKYLLYRKKVEETKQNAPYYQKLENFFFKIKDKTGYLFGKNFAAVLLLRTIS
jgi:hypothetical protein